MTRSFQRWLFVIAAVGAVLVITFLVVALPPPKPAPLPNPNGYHDLVKAAGMIGPDFADVESLSQQELLSLVSTNTEALKLARTGLSRECHVVPPSSITAMQEHVETIGNLKRLGRAFAAEARLAELQGQSDLAASNFIETIQLGQRLASGGVIIDALVGLALENAGVRRLQKLLPTLNANTCKQTAARLEQIEAQRLPPSVTLQYEAAWVRRVYGFQGQIARLFTASSLKKGERSFVSKANQQAARNRELLVALASKAYELEHGKAPGDIAALVPQYLKAAPLDPVSRKPMNVAR